MLEWGGVGWGGVGECWSGVGWGGCPVKLLVHTLFRRC